MVKLLKSVSVFQLPAYLLFFLMLFVPTAYQPLKAVLIVVVLATILMEAFLTKRFAVHSTVLALTLAMSLTGLAFVNLGLLNRNPGALRVMAVYVFWPLLYLLFVAGSARVAILKGLMQVLAAATIAISIYTLLYILHSANVLPGFLYYELDQGQSIGFYDGHIRYALYSISSLLFLVPFLLSALVLWPRDIEPPVSRRWLWIAFLISVPPVFLTERKILWLLVLATPFMALALRSILPVENKRATRKIARRTVLGIVGIGVVLLLVLRFALNFDFAVISNLIGDALNLSSGTSEDVVVRKGQYVAMMSEWANSPLLGTGLGGVASYVRNDEQPWTYELSYVALLYHTGIIGVLIYAAGIIWTYWNSFLVIRTDRMLGLYMAPILVGTTCFLIGNATNPYLEKYDYLWVLFLPIAIINLWMLQRRRLPREAVVHVTA